MTLGPDAIQKFYDALIQSGQIFLAELLESSQNVAPASANDKKLAEINPCRYSYKTVNILMFRVMIDCTRSHIQNLCDQLHKTRKHVFSASCGDDFGSSNYFSPDFVKMKYDHNKIGSREERLVEDGEHFGDKELVDSIASAAPDSVVNFLLEVTFYRFTHAKYFISGTCW